MLLPISQNMSAERLKGLVPYWLKHLEQRIAARELSPDTLASYKGAVSLFLSWLGDRQAMPDVILAWKVDLYKKGYHVSTVNKLLTGLRSFFTMLASTGQIPFDPARAIRNSRRMTAVRHTHQPLTDNEVRKLLAQPNRQTIKGKRDYAILNLMLYTGARTVEVHRADVSDLQIQSGKRVLMVQGKGHIEKDAVLVLLGAVETAMTDWLAIRGDKPGALFISLSNRNRNERLSRMAVRHRIRRYLARAGVLDKSKTPHSLRHTAITNAIRHHVPFEKLRGMSRHATINSLLVYYHEMDRIDDPAEKYIDYGE